MSNLLKYHTIQCDGDKKIIDYNALIAEKLSKIQETEPEDVLGAQGGFMAGLVAEEVELVQEEPEIVDVSPEELLEEARQQAGQLLEDARAQAEQLRQQAYQEGSKQGYDKGYAQAIADGDREKQKLEEERQRLLRSYNEQLNEMEPMLVDAITKVVEEVFRIKFEDNRNMIIHLLKNALEHVESSKEYIVKVSRHDYPAMMKYREVLEKTVTKAASIEIMEDIGLAKNQCLIETDGGVFDCSLDVQLDNLVKTLKILSHS